MNVVWIGLFDTRSALYAADKIEIARSLVSFGDSATIVGYTQGIEPGPEYPCEVIELPVPFGRQSAYRVVAALWLLWRCLRGGCPDWIIADCWSASVLVPAIAYSRLRGLRTGFLLDIRTVPVDQRPRPWRVWKRGIRLANRTFDGLSTISPALAAVLTTTYGVDAVRLGVWGSGVNVEAFNPADPDRLIDPHGERKRPMTFLYSGSVTKERGVLALARAVESLSCETESPVRLLVIGAGDADAELREMSSREQASTTYLGRVPHADVPRVAEVADVGVCPLPDLPAWRVSFPLKVVEYMALGLPVLATDIEAHRHVLGEIADSVFWAEPTQAGLVDAVRRAARADRETLRRMGDAGRALVEAKYTWEKQALALKLHLERLSGLASGRTGTPESDVGRAS